MVGLGSKNLGSDQAQDAVNKLGMTEVEARAAKPLSRLLSRPASIKHASCVNFAPQQQYTHSQA